MKIPLSPLSIERLPLVDLSFHEGWKRGTSHLCTRNNLVDHECLESILCKTPTRDCYEGFTQDPKGGPENRAQLHNPVGRNLMRKTPVEGYELMKEMTSTSGLW